MVNPERFATAQVLRFDPDWIKDPVNLLLHARLDTVDLARLAVIHLQLQKHILEGQMRAADQAMEIAQRLAK